jgi:lipopolysaccharide biosynthesis protein
MKPILVHCHIYYADLWPELRSCLLNMQAYPFQLFVTMVQELPEIGNDIRQTFSQAQIEIIENRGYDVAPFIHLLNSINPDDYSYVVKLHTKRNLPTGALVNYFDVSGAKWRNYALSFVTSPDKFQQCVRAFENNAKLGMITNYHLIMQDEQYDKTAQTRVFKLLEQLEYTSSHYKWVAGTMFMTRACILKPLQRFYWTNEDFATPDQKHSTQLAHVIERLLGCLCVNQGYEIDDIFASSKEKKQAYSRIRMQLRRLAQFLYRKKASHNGTLKINICKIPVCRKKLHQITQKD